ncbi:zinc finger protein [Theobroma cacao]|nr:zinc finger protein [Theobroma cacao]
MDNFDQKLGPDFLKNLSGETISPLSVVIHEDIYESSSKRPKTTSKVWDVFEKLPAQQGDSKAICKLCRRIYTAKTTSGTSHLRRHIEACLKRGNHDLDQRSTEACFKPVNRDANRHTEMQSKFNQYWSEYNLILSCAAILDPRYKIKFVEYCYTKLYGSGAQQYVSASVNTLYGLFHDYMQNSACPSHPATLSVLTTKISNDKDDNDGRFRLYGKQN